jgi:hypothetical protein
LGLQGRLIPYGGKMDPPLAYKLHVGLACPEGTILPNQAALNITGKSEQCSQITLQYFLRVSLRITYSLLEVRR